MENQAGLERGMNLVGPLTGGEPKYMWTVSQVRRKSVTMISFVGDALMEANITTPPDMRKWEGWSLVRYVDGMGLVTLPMPEPNPEAHTIGEDVRV